MVNSRMEGLLVQAREIAYLAANLDSSSVWTTDESTMNYLQWKARNVYEDYGAYLLIVDRSGHGWDSQRAFFAYARAGQERLQQKPRFT